LRSNSNFSIHNLYNFFQVYDNGSTLGIIVNDDIDRHDIRPVINLRSDVEITDATQTGTSTNYYVIKTN